MKAVLRVVHSPKQDDVNVTEFDCVAKQILFRLLSTAAKRVIHKALQVSNNFLLLLLVLLEVVHGQRCFLLSCVDLQ